ncbi:MAG: DUF302 domain-containing protein [Actinomycetota bacterium]|nr:DUF302 domain-containing protein [Actinomycetota bacterium]
MSDYGYALEVPATYDEAVIRTRLALRGEGFSILTESHVGGMLPEIGDERQYLFMGAWNTGITDEADPQVRVALNLPCNVVVQERGPVTLVAALDPLDSVDPSDDRSLTVAETARAALGRAFDRIKQDA